MEIPAPPYPRPRQPEFLGPVILSGGFLASLLELRRPSFHCHMQYPKASSLLSFLLWHCLGSPKKRQFPSLGSISCVSCQSFPVTLPRLPPYLVCKLLGITTFQPLIKVPVVQRKQTFKPLLLPGSWRKCSQAASCGYYHNYVSQSMGCLAQCWRCRNAQNVCSVVHS